MRRPKDDLTPGQASALYCLLCADTLSVLVPSAQRTTDSDFAPWSIGVHRVAAEALVALGLAKALNVLPHGGPGGADREIRGADLISYLGFWRTKFKITARGKLAWRRFTVHQRYGLPEQAEVSS